MKSNDSASRWLSKCRDEWSRIVNSQEQTEDIFGSIPDVPSSAVLGARLFANRNEAIASLKRGGAIAEIGALVGEFSQVMWRNLEPSSFHLFDLHYDRWRRKNPELDEDPRVTFHIGDSSTSLEELPDQFFDIIYIDADHSEDGVRKDTKVSIRKLKPDGVLVFDDYTIWSPFEFLDYGIVQVVNPLLDSGEWVVEYLSLDPYMYCNIAIRRSDYSD